MVAAKISIITPAYNCAQWLPETIESVLVQTYENFELLIIDDGSTDNTKEVVQPYLSSGKVQYFRQENSGQASARNYGLKKSTGKYVAYLDSDDTWEPTKLKKQIDLLESLDVQVCYTGVNLIDEDGKITEHSPQGALAFRKGMVVKYLFVDNFIPFSSVIIRKECLKRIGGSDVSIRKSDDWDLLLRLSVFCKFDYVDENLMNYRVSRDGQISVDRNGRFESINRIADNFMKNNHEILSSELVKKSYAYRCRQYAYDIFGQNSKEAMCFYWRAFCCDPFCLSLYKSVLNSYKGLILNG